MKCSVRALCIALLAAVLAAIPMAGCAQSRVTPSGGTQASQQAPAIDLASLSGPRVTSDSLKGKPTLLNFGASW